MSVVLPIEGPPVQPYQCSVCHSRFTRHENLKRHAQLHSRPEREPALSCELCHATFSRADLRLRHVKRKHPEQVQAHGTLPRRDLQRPTQPDRKRRRRTPAESSSPEHTFQDVNEGIQPTTFDQDDAVDIPLPIGNSIPHPSPSEATYNNATVADPFLDPIQRVETNTSATTTSPLSPFSANLASIFTDGLSPTAIQQSQHDWYPSASQLALGTDLFFKHVSHFVPFLHQATFDANNIAPHLPLSMLSLAYQHSEDPDSDLQPGTGASLSARCFLRARAMAAQEEDSANPSADYVATIQSYLLLQIYAMMYSSRSTDSAYALQIHSKMISLARACGLMQALTTDSSAPTDCLDALWRRFALAESHKRTLFAVHQIDAMWYQLLSIPRSLSHLEIKQELPCPAAYWTAASSVEWAHRRLTAATAATQTSQVQYPEAVRRFLSADSANLVSIPAFDPYGAINLMQFLVSSAREISGWSTMTGMLSIERLEPLRSSLLALSPFVRATNASTADSALCEATWETAMIEVHMWSPSHTGGIVEGSIDAVLHQLTYLASCCEYLCEPSIAKLIQPHLDWFLRYLDSTEDPESEAPWVLLYAYKAFILAWQLLCQGTSGCLSVIGVEDGDVEGALAWARGVFGRRERWWLGGVIMGCLETLERGVVE